MWVNSHLRHGFAQTFGDGGQRVVFIACPAGGAQCGEQFTKQSEQDNFPAWLPRLEFREQSSEPALSQGRGQRKNRICLHSQSGGQLPQPRTIKSKPVEIPRQIDRGAMRMGTFIAEPSQPPWFDLPPPALTFYPPLAAAAVKQILPWTSGPSHLFARRRLPPTCA